MGLCHLALGRSFSCYSLDALAIEASSSHYFTIHPRESLVFVYDPPTVHIGCKEISIIKEHGCRA